MGYRNYGPAAGYTVAKDGTGDFATIAAALTAAGSLGGNGTIYIKDGTYAENPALVVGWNMVAWDADALTPNVIINGKCTLSTAGTVTISGIQLQTNSDFFLAVTGSAASIVFLVNSFLNCLNNTGISFTTSSASAQINIYKCTGNLATTGIGCFAHSSNGTLNFKNTSIENSGSSTTASTVSSSTVDFKFCSFNSPITTSSTGAIGAQFALFACGPINTIALTLNGSGTSSIINSIITSGSASSISVGASETLGLYNCTLTSANTNCITGSGTLNYGSLSLTSSSVINTSTLVGAATDTGSITFDAGTNLLSKYIGWTSFTPTLTGQSTAGTTTYSSQTGVYSRIGNIVVVQLDIQISAATGTGNVVIGGLPFTVNGANFIGAAYLSGYTMPVGTTSALIDANTGATTAVILCYGSAISGAFLQMSNGSREIAAFLVYRI